jgi:hypothetical protein
MFGLPLLAGLVGLAFGAILLKQFADRRRPHQAAWGGALICFGAAALWEAAGVYGGWTPLLYKGYYLLGAILNVGWLGVGTIYVLAPRRWGHLAAAIMGVVTVLAVVCSYDPHHEFRVGYAAARAGRRGSGRDGR